MMLSGLQGILKKRIIKQGMTKELSVLGERSVNVTRIILVI